MPQVVHLVMPYDHELQMELEGGSTKDYRSVLTWLVENVKDDAELEIIVVAAAGLFQELQRKAVDTPYVSMAECLDTAIVWLRG